MPSWLWLGQVLRGSSGTTVPGPGPTGVTISQSAATSASALSVQASTPLRVEDGTEFFTSLHPCLCGPCGHGVECWVFRSNVPRSESPPRQRLENHRRYGWSHGLSRPVPTSATAAVCSPSLTCQRRHSRHDHTHRHHVSSALANVPGLQVVPADQPQQASFARLGSSWQVRCQVARASPLRVSRCLMTQRHRTRTARSDVKVGGVGGITTQATSLHLPENSISLGRL